MGKKLTILLANDDGIDAPGLNALKSELEKNHNVYVCAPDGERSSNGHAITYAKSVKAICRNERSWAVDGTPADCVIFALSYAFKDVKFDLVISGINLGANLGNDQYYSGTMGAAREAIYSNVPAISCSLATSSVFKGLESEPKFSQMAQWISIFISRKIELIKEALRDDLLININYPNITEENIKGVRLTRPGTQLYEKIYSPCPLKENHFWMRGGHVGHSSAEDDDTQAISEHFISLTPYKLLKNLSDASVKWEQLID